MNHTISDESISYFLFHPFSSPNSFFHLSSFLFLSSNDNGHSVPAQWWWSSSNVIITHRKRKGEKKEVIRFWCCKQHRKVRNIDCLDLCRTIVQLCVRSYFLPGVSISKFSLFPEQTTQITTTSAATTPLPDDVNGSRRRIWAPLKKIRSSSK